jgi:hypothetical protein
MIEQNDPADAQENLQLVETKKEPTKALTIGLEDKYLTSDSLEGRYRLAKAFIAGGMVPKSYNTPEQVFAGLEFARELGLKPLTGLRSIAVINGTPSIFGDLPLALVRRAGLIVSITEYCFDKDYNKISFDNKNLNAPAYGAVCVTKRINNEYTHETTFTLDDAKKAGLLDKSGPWKTYPKRMLQMRARSQNLKDQFSDALFNISIAEYDFNYMPRESGPVKNLISFKGEEIVNTSEVINSTLS